MAEFNIGADQYRTDRIPPKMQMRVIKRLARIAPALKGVGAIKDRMKGGVAPNIEELADIFTPVISAFSEMPDEDVEYVIDTALEHAWHKPPSEPRWYPVRRNGIVSNNNNEEIVRSLTITYHVLQDNFSAIFNSLPKPAEEPQA